MVDDTGTEDAQRDQWVIEIAEGMSAVALIGALIVTLKEKGILSDDDLQQIETNADQYFANDLRSVGGRTPEGERSQSTGPPTLPANGGSLCEGSGHV